MKTINRSSAILTALAAFLISLPAQAAQKPPVPASGVYLGATLPSVNDLAYNEARTPAQFNADIGVNHAIFMAFLEFPGVMSALDEKARITTFIEECAGVGAIPAITLRVPGGLNSYTTQDIEAFADFLNSFNVPIFLRWCHEMNGSWYAWGQQPELYVQKFQEFATVIHSRATGVAMTWTPNGATQAAPMIRSRTSMTALRSTTASR
ncbi:MAG: glycosyl hydrolase [Verrucomicrobia bacterium]|nr:glycosyl hydrolase [Verrucomicrobiota bacterium]